MSSAFKAEYNGLLLKLEVDILRSFPHHILSLSVPQLPHFLSPAPSLVSVAASASDLNTQQGVVGRDSRCEGSL